MRRWHFRHEQKTLPRVVHAGGLTAAAAPGAVRAEEFSLPQWNVSASSDLATSGNAGIRLAGQTSHAYFHTTSAVTEIVIDGFYYRLAHAAFKGKAGDQPGDMELRSEIPGRIIKVIARAGDIVAAGEPLLIQEAMKMEMTLKAPSRCRIAEVLVEAGAQVDADAVLMRFEAVRE